MDICNRICNRGGKEKCRSVRGSVIEFENRDSLIGYVKWKGKRNATL